MSKIAKKILIGTTILLLTFSLFQQIRRIIFVVQNNGMEKINGDGSPVAFLLGWSIESFLLFYFFAVLYFLIKKPQENIT